MKRSLHRYLPYGLLACAGTAAAAWLGLYGYAWSDYESEAQPAFEALIHGHVLSFLRLAPAYGGSLVERAPFALLPGLWGGGKLAVFRVVSLPCLLVAAALGVWVVAQMRARADAGQRPDLPGRPRERTAPGRAGRSGRWMGGRPARGLALVLFAVNPVTVLALEIGHPEELLGATLCIAAVLLAARDHPAWAGIALGLAIANKEWAVVATGPVLLAAARHPAQSLVTRRRPRALAGSPAREPVLCALSAAATAAVVIAPLVLVPGGRFVAGARGAASTSSSIFLPWSVWWFFGHPGPPVRESMGGLATGFRVGPVWAGPISHPAIVLVGIALPALLWLGRGRGRAAAHHPAHTQEALGRGPGVHRAGDPGPGVHRAGDPGPGVFATVSRGPAARSSSAISENDALLALALALLARCALDTWDLGYYWLPFLLSVLTWEALREPLRPPLLALASTVFVLASFVWLPHWSATPDLESAAFLAWVLPLATVLALRLYAPARAASMVRAARRFAAAGTLRHARAKAVMTPR